MPTSPLEEEYSLEFKRLVASLQWRLEVPEDAFDIVQEQFVKRAAGKLKKGGLWIAAQRQSINHEKHVRKARLVAPEILESLTGSVPTPIEAAAAAEVRRLVRAAIRALPREFRQVLLLRFYRGLSFDQIARRLAICGPTARSRAWRALQLVEPLLRKSGISGSL